MTEPRDVLSCAAAIRAGETTSVAQTQRSLDAIQQCDDTLGAMLWVGADEALQRAAHVDDLLQKGRDLGPIAGVPLTIKDVISLQGAPLTAGSRILEGYAPPFNATVTTRLLDAGAVILGKNNLDEFAMGSSNENSAYHPARNPWDPQRVPGGSSGGSAVATAAGYGFGSLGTDTGGSVRLPAALCGVVGLKPTYGRVSRHGVVAFASSLDQVGPFARSVADCAALLDVIAGPCQRDSTCSQRPHDPTLPQLDRDLQGLRVGVPRPFFAAAEGLDAGVRQSVQDALGTLEELGAEVIEVELPHSAYAIATYYVVATAEASANLQRYDGVRFGRRAELDIGDSIETLHARTRAEGFGPEVQRRIILGTFALSSGFYDAYYDKACRVRRLIHDDFTEALRSCDVLVGPTSPVPAWPLGERTADPLSMYLMDVFTTGASLAGVPGLSVPIAPVHGLPVGLQILGRHFDEATLLRVGHHLCARTGHHLATPPLGVLEPRA